MVTSYELEDTSTIPPLTKLCPNGDLTLSVEKDDGTILARYRVLKSTMCLASPVWRAMLTGPFIELGKDEIPFLDDDPEALLIMLHIAHLQMHKVPKTIDNQFFFNVVATVCDKYDTVAICRPFVDGWVKKFFAAESVITEFIGEPRYLHLDPRSWLWILWVFGYQTEFVKLVDKLQRVVATNEAGACFGFFDFPRGLRVPLDTNVPNILGKYPPKRSQH